MPAYTRLLSRCLSLFVAGIRAVGIRAVDKSIIPYDKKHHIAGKSAERSIDEMKTMFESWMLKHGKTYNDLGEKEKRFEIFKDKLRYIDYENALPDRSYKLGLNPFYDLTNEEFRKTHTGRGYRNGERRRRASQGLRQLW